MDDGRRTMNVDYVSVTQYEHAKGSRKICEERVFFANFLSCHAVYKYFVSRLCHTKKDFQITVSFQTKCDGIF